MSGARWRNLLEIGVQQVVHCSRAAQFPERSILDLPHALFSNTTTGRSGGSKRVPLPVGESEAHCDHTPFTRGEAPGLDAGIKRCLEAKPERYRRCREGFWQRKSSVLLDALNPELEGVQRDLPPENERVRKQEVLCWRESLGKGDEHLASKLPRWGGPDFPVPGPALRARGVRASGGRWASERRTASQSVALVTIDGSGTNGRRSSHATFVAVTIQCCGGVAHSQETP